MSSVYVTNKQNGTTYVYDSTGYWDKEKQQARNSRVCIGKMVDGTFVPNKRFVMQQQIDQLQRQPGPVASTEFTRLCYGAVHVFDEIGKRYGITQDLKSCFPNIYEQLLSVAYYLILEDRNPLSRFPKWARTHAHPYGKIITSQRSSELLSKISEEAKQRFFQLQANRLQESEFLAYDTTSISSHSQLINQVRFGKNKDHDRLAQVNLAVLFAQSSRLPVYYRKLAGNIADVSTIKHLIGDIQFLDIKKVKLILDRGFYSKSNIDALFRNHYKFLIAVKVSLKFVQDHLDQVRDTMHTRSSYSSSHRLHFHTTPIEWDYEEHKARLNETLKGKRRSYLHIFYDDQRAVDDKRKFHDRLDTYEKELISGKKVAHHAKQYQQFFIVKKTPVRGVSITYREDEVRGAERNFGYFALLSNAIKDPIEALETYRSKDLIEKTFDNLKDRLNMKRTYVSSEENLEGKFFVHYVALLFLSYIDAAMKREGLYKNHTLQGVLDNLDLIERFEQPGKRPRIGEITEKQRNLYNALGIPIPS
jgi:transposase